MRSRVFIVLMALAGALTLSGGGGAHAAGRPDGPVDAAQCVSCHAQSQPELVRAWRTSGHGAGGASCLACHGAVHDAAVQARRDETCMGCHGGAEAPVTHSYATSKHGLLVKLEAPHWDWTQPLRAANYRAPGCAYCHFHQGGHDSRRMLAPAGAATASAEAQRARDNANAVCYDCHAPRYVARLSEGGARMLDIAYMKQREAHVLVEAARAEHSDLELTQAMELLVRMQRHVKNVRLGSGHQSPDYQWWHGQPALDGDLLRIKGELSRLRRAQQAGRGGAAGMDLPARTSPSPTAIDLR